MAINISPKLKDDKWVNYAIRGKASATGTLSSSKQRKIEFILEQLFINQILKDEPQPQVVWALGLRMTNWEPLISSL